jgi:hypothetical protein
MTGTVPTTVGDDGERTADGRELAESVTHTA